MLQGVWSSPGALRPATSPWHAARGTKGRLECLYMLKKGVRYANSQSPQL